MLKVQGSLVLGKFFDGLRVAKNGASFATLRINVGNSVAPKWCCMNVFGSEHQLNSLVNTLKNNGNHTSLLVRGNVSANSFTYANKDGEVQDSVGYSLSFSALQYWDKEENKWKPVQNLVQKAK